jgi:hypothetical protein
MILCLSMLSAAFAQSNRGNERIESMRIAFITDRLQLTPAEAQRFWPVFNEYTSELKSLRQSYRQDGDHDEPINSENQLDFEQKKLNLKRKYIPQFREAVGQQKVDLLIRAEEDFKRKLVESLRNRN